MPNLISGTVKLWSYLGRKCNLLNEIVCALITATIINIVLDVIFKTRDDFVEIP